MKTYMPLNGLRWSRNSGSANCDMPQSAVFGRPGGGNFLKKFKCGKILVYLGSNSMPYYCFHWIILMVINSYVELYGLDPYFKMICMIISSMVILPIVDFVTKRKTIRFIIGGN